MDDFEQILKSMGLYHIYILLNREGLDSFNSLLNYNSEDLETLGINNLSERIKLMRLVKEHAEEEILTEEKIIVCVRKRPIEDENDDAVDIIDNNIIVNEPKLKVDLQSFTEKHQFVFDLAFEKNTTNANVYQKGLRAVVNHVINGGCGSIIAYGQTGTGKTYTMMEENNGVIYRALTDISKHKSTGVVTFCEIYLGNIYDLLNKREKITLREAGGIVHLSNSSTFEFKSYDDICRIINKGLHLRRTGITGANSKSSRSHAVLIVSYDKKKSNAINSSNSLIFVDLAGSERGNDRKSISVETKNEGAEINKSLLALKECIRGIEQDKKHLPFRQSKLTQILKNSFIGESKTCIIATISPSYENLEHTLNTLRYASRIKDFKKNSIKTPTKESPHSSISNKSSLINSSFLTNSSLFFSPKFNISQEVEIKDTKKIAELKMKTKNILDEVYQKVDHCEYDELVRLYNKLDDILKSVDR
ncbi:hypothetical protein P3W45_000084 [Vairimorpha bombi]|jgi:kinesin family member 2/24